MAIIRYTKDATIRYAYLNIFPDQFKTEKEKENPSYIKNTLDYFANRAYAEYMKNRESFVRNYDLMKGILNAYDFYQEDEDVKSFAETLQEDLSLPSYVKHYSIITTPINNLVGELSKRPDTFRAKAFDDDSQAQELQYKTEILQEYVINQAKQKILQKAAMAGEQIDEEELEQRSLEDVKEDLDSYTSVAEKWANHVITCQKADFNLKEKSEDAYRDLLIASREFYFIYEDNSKLGFNVVVANPKNVWVLTTPDKKYISDPTGRQQGAYAAGTVEIMELSEIIESCPDLTKEEIDHLRSSLQDYGLINVRESNLGNPSAPEGIDSIQYDTYDPFVLQSRMLVESEMKENSDSLNDFLGLTANVSAFGYKYVVVRSYWLSKKKIGKLIYLDELENEQTILVDENYKSGTIPTQLSLEWGWINQWYQGTKIGPDIYHMKPFKLLNYCPIIGTLYEVKNTEAKGFLDMMKPFQIMYNVCMNQLYKLLEKEIGNVASINVRRIPKLKDGDDQDALDVWEMEARERGVVFDDDSPENTKSPVSNTSIAKNIDLTRTNEIQSRYTLAVQLKTECWELAGITRQRLGEVSASESATGTNTAMQQSYTQTEPLFVAHEYVLGQLYQAIVDAALYIESNKDVSTLSYITSEGETAFVQVNGSDLKLRDLKVFMTNRPEDTQMFNELRQLSQAILQNGGNIYDVVELYSTKSMREMKKTFEDLRDRMIAQQDELNRQTQAKLDQEREIAAAQIEQAASDKEQDRLNENYQNDLDRINKKEVALISAEAKGGPATDVDDNNIPDVLEISKLNNERGKLDKDYQVKIADIQSKSSQARGKLKIEEEKIKVARENMLNDKQIAIINSRNRGSGNNKKK